MTRRSHPFSPFFCLASLVASLGAYGASPAAAQDSAVVQRLVQNAQMPRPAAAALVAKIDARLQADANEGGNAFNTDLRRDVHAALFGDGPPPRAEYNARLQATLGRMQQGMNVQVMERIFRRQNNAAVLCANEYGVTMGECDALLAGATLTPSALPYIPPDDGTELQAEMRRGRVNRRVAREVATGLRELMLGVPRNLRNDARGRAVISLMETCPGGSSDRESQVRAWHVGPTVGLARCIAYQVARRGGTDMAEAVLGFSPRAARAFLEWGAPGESGPVAQTNTAPPPPRMQPTMRQQPTPTGPQVTGMSAAEALRQQAQAQFRLRNYPAAVSAYEAAANLEGDHAPTFAGLGAAYAAMGNLNGAVRAFQRAVQLDQRNVGYFVMLGRALAQNNQRDAAVAALQQAMRIDRNNMTAREGLRALGGEPPPPPLPQTPPREAIIATMQPLRGALQGCAPSFTGHVVIRFGVTGSTGVVHEAVVEGVENEDESICMANVVQSARFPRFLQDELSISYPYELAPQE